MNQEDLQLRQQQKGTVMSRSLHDDVPMFIVVTGIMAAGKSTIAHLLAQRFVRGVHVEADVLQRMIVSGAEWVSQPGDPGGEAAQQLRLRLKNMCLLGKSFFEAGFTVVLDDIIMGDRWHQLQEELSGFPFSLVVLAPHVDVVAQQRDINRQKDPQGHTCFNGSQSFVKKLSGAFQRTAISSENSSPNACTYRRKLLRLYAS